MTSNDINTNYVTSGPLQAQFYKHKNTTPRSGQGDHHSERKQKLGLAEENGDEIYYTLKEQK